MTRGKSRKSEFSALCFIAYKKARAEALAMQRRQPMRSGCAPAEPYPHGCIKMITTKAFE